MCGASVFSASACLACALACGRWLCFIEWLGKLAASATITNRGMLQECETNAALKLTFEEAVRMRSNIVEDTPNFEPGDTIALGPLPTCPTGTLIRRVPDSRVPVWIVDMHDGGEEGILESVMHLVAKAPLAAQTLETAAAR